MCNKVFIAKVRVLTRLVCIYSGVQLKSRLQHTQNLIDRRQYYRPAVFYRDSRLTALSFLQEKIPNARIGLRNDVSRDKVYGAT